MVVALPVVFAPGPPPVSLESLVSEQAAAARKQTLAARR